jgi:hypothetical protein
MIKQNGSTLNRGQYKTKQNKATAKPWNNTKHNKGHADHEESQAGDQAAAVKDQ